MSFGTLCDIVEAGRMYRDGKVIVWNRDRESVRAAEADVLKRGVMLKKKLSKPEAGLLF